MNPAGSSKDTRPDSGRSRAHVHVNATLLDELLALVGELVMQRALLSDIGRQARQQHGFKEPIVQLLGEVEDISRLTQDVQHSVMRARMVPMQHLFRRFERLLAELSARGDKILRLAQSGSATEVDKKIADALMEPLVHLVRNAVDHGIETAAVRRQKGKVPEGTITLHAEHDTNQLVVEVRDDGAGLNVARIKEKALTLGLYPAAQLDQMSVPQLIDLVFTPGFSTREQVSSVSGRGIGMDAARRRVDSLGGTLTLDLLPHGGTRARIRLPLTLAIMQGLAVRVGKERYALALEHVQETVRIWPVNIETLDGREVLPLRGEALPLLWASHRLDVGAPEPISQVFVVVVRTLRGRVGLIVDQVLGSRELVVKPLGKRLGANAAITGACIDTTGDVLLVLDVPRLCVDVVS